MKTPRGHSNVYASTAKPWPEAEGPPDKAMIRLEGGASVYTVQDLPPLALSRCEWEMIGEAMGWKPKDKPRKLRKFNFK